MRVQISLGRMSVCDHDPCDPEPLDLFDRSGESADMVMNQSHSWPDSAEDYNECPINQGDGCVLGFILTCLGQSGRGMKLQPII